MMMDGEDTLVDVEGLFEGLMDNAIDPILAQAVDPSLMVREPYENVASSSRCADIFVR